MKTDYDINSYFRVLGIPHGATPYSVDNMPTLTAYLRGNVDNMHEMLSDTPFELIGDRFAVLVADFSKSTAGSFFDSGLVIPVRYRDQLGALYRYEFEDHSWSIAFGREVWGYPKQFADISLTFDERSAHASVELRGESFMDVRFTADETLPDDPDWLDMKMYPHLLVHAQPAADSGTFRTFEIVSRDTSADSVVKSRTLGSATVELGGPLSHVVIEEVLGASLSVTDYRCTASSGRAKVIDQLVAG